MGQVCTRICDSVQGWRGAPPLEDSYGRQIELRHEASRPAQEVGARRVSWLHSIPKGWTKNAEIDAVELRGVSLEKLTELFNFQKEVFSRQGHSKKNSALQNINGERATLEDIYQHVVGPLTRLFQCSLAEVLAAAAQEPAFFASYTDTLPLKDALATLRAHSQHHNASAYWFRHFAARPGDAALLQEGAAPLVMGQASCLGCVALLNVEKPGVCAFRSAWCLMELAAAVQESTRRSDFNVDFGAHVSRGALKFGDPKSSAGMEDVAAGTVIQFQKGSVFLWERKDDQMRDELKLGWPVWTLRESCAVFYEAPGASLWQQPPEMDLAHRAELQDLREHLQRRFASSAIQGLSGGRPQCVVDVELLKSLLTRFPEAVNEPGAFGETPAFRAAAWGCSELLLLLVKAGADVSRPREDGVIPKEAAAAYGHEHVLQLLEEPHFSCSKPEARSMLALQDDIPWAVAVPIPPALVEKVTRPKPSRPDDPEFNGITLEQLEQLGQLVEAVLNSAVYRSRDGKRVVWNTSGLSSLQSLEVDISIASTAKEAQRVLQEMEEVTSEERTAQEVCYRLRSQWQSHQKELEKVTASCNLYHVNDLILQTVACRHRCSWVHLVAESEEQTPVFFVSHWWGGSFQETIEKLRFHSLERDIQGAFWICTFANNQLEFSLDAEIDQTPFSKVLRKSSCRGTVALIDPKVVIFQRVWCIYELYKSLDIQQHEPERNFLYDVAAYSLPGELVWGNDGDGYWVVPQGAILELDAAGTRAQHEGLEVPGALASAGIEVDVFNASASQEEDRRQILRKVAGVSQGAADPLSTHGAFAALNKQVARRFSGQVLSQKIQHGEEVASLRQLLDEFPASVNFQDGTGTCPLLVAARFGREGALQMLLEARAEPNLARGDGATPLLIASEHGHEGCLNILLEAGANPNLADDDGVTPTFTASASGHDGSLKLLIEARADPNLAKTTGATPAYIASQEGHAGSLRILLEARADPNLARSSGATPAIMASKNGHEGALKMLLEAMADPNLARNDGATPAIMASQNGHDGVLEILLEARADPNLAMNDGSTPAIMASWQGHEQALKILLEANADPAHANDIGETPLQLAQDEGYDKVVQILEKALRQQGQGS